MSQWIQSAADFLWGLPMLSLVLGVGLYLLFRLGAVQIRQFARSLRDLLRAPVADPSAGEITPFAALMTAVGGIVGNGNIAGVATAITSGGPGALFWMWFSGLVGMGTMFAESVLGIVHRRKGVDGLYVGGPMYYLEDALGWPLVASFFAVGMALKTLLATTTVQSNSMSLVAASELGWSPGFTCSLAALVTGATIVGGVRSIARVSEILSPFMGLLYLAGAAGVLWVFRGELLTSLALVMEHAFTPIAAGGGFLGASVRQAFRFGVARGVYSNEAGTGSVPIAHASARTDNPVAQGRIAMLGVFLDTMVVSSATGLVLLATGAWQSGLESTTLTARAFAMGLGGVGGTVVLAASLLFGLSTLITWAFYGEQCAAYLLGPRARRPYRLLYCVAIVGGSLAGAQAIWAWADLLNGIMAIPNLVALALLAGSVAQRMRPTSAAAAADSMSSR
jgi:AGCS family alanine or glycine:cation symporter